MKLAIVEDDRSYRERLHSYVARFEQETKTHIEIAIFTDGTEIVEWYEKGHTLEVILLDIEMRRMDGMKAAERIREMDADVIIIYITNMAQFGIRGYEVGALDFIVKPVDYEIFAAKLKKAQRRLSSREKKYITIRNKDEILRLCTDDIIYVEVRNHSLLYHTMKRDLVCTGSLKEAEQTLGQYGFSRCKSCYLVHLSHVMKVSNDYVVVSNGDMLQISKTRRIVFMQELTDYLGERR